VLTADCLFTSQRAWQRRVECSGLSGVSGHWTGPLSYWWRHIILCVVLVEAASYLGHLKNFLIDCLIGRSGFYAIIVVVGRRDSWGREKSRQQARKLQCLVWVLPAEAHQLTGYSQLWSCGGRGRASDHWATSHHPAVTISWCGSW